MNTSFRLKIVLLAILSSSFLSLMFLAWAVYQLIRTPLIPINHPPLMVSIDKSSSAYDFVHRLKQMRTIRSPTLLLWTIRLQGLSQQLRAGIYQIKPGETPLHLLHRVVAGDVLTHYFTIIAGTTQAKVDQDLQKAIHLDYQSADWALVKQSRQNAEGLLLAETYQYQAQSGSKALLEQAHQALMKVLDNAWQAREPNLPYKTPYELLIAASIIEKESALISERKLIAGVVVNRLKKGMPLQMDPTVIYGLSTAYQGKLSHQDLSIDSPYNSYRHRGLPPTPIAMVSRESIMAAAHPTLSQFLYFVAKGDGSHQFSETYDEQKKAIHHYQHKDS